MKKKILLGLVAVVAVVGGVAALSAYEAHVINVTATIENALAVSVDELPFGTVFPQEDLKSLPFTISLSDSFTEQSRVDRVDYAIWQKAKPCPEEESQCGPGGYYLDLCKFLSKEAQDNDGDISEGSYYPTCPVPPQLPSTGASGYLVTEEDESDTWNVDLKVPPVAGSVGQDWPQACIDNGYVVPTNSAVYGCDLWIEVTGISSTPK